MVGYIEESKGGDFKPTPEGVHVMVCTRVIDIGTQKTEYQGEIKHQRKIAISWEIPGERTVFDDQDAPMLHTERYTWSFHEKASLRKVLEAWRGMKFRDEDFRGKDGGFHIAKLLGVPCMGQVMHEQAANGKTYANLASVMKFGAPKDAWPKPEGELLFLDLDNFDPVVFEKLSEYWQGVIKASPEGAAALSGNGEQVAAAPAHALADDEIPF